MDELKESWVMHFPTPWQIYIKTLQTLIGDRLDGEDGPEIGAGTKIEEMLTDFQRDAVHLAERYIEKWGGCFVSDVVGLGKSYIGAAICKRYEQLRKARILIICPKSLHEMWDRYNEEYELNARVVSMSLLSERSEFDLSDYDNRDFVLIDESHAFRNGCSQRYAILDDFLADGTRKVCLLTATPLNSRPMDIYHQLKLFHREDRTALAIDPPDLKAFFGQVEKKQAKLTSLLPQILIRRRRRDVLRLYGFAGDNDVPLKNLTEEEASPYLHFTKKAYVNVGGKKQFFPKRHLETWRYSIEDTYTGLYDQLRGFMGAANPEDATNTGDSLKYARYGLWHYVIETKQESDPYLDLHRAGINLRGLIRSMLFKRFESSVFAFQRTLERMIASQKLFLKALERGTVAAGEDAQSILRLAAYGDEDELLAELDELTTGYDIKDFRVDDLTVDISADVVLLEKMLQLVQPIEPKNDDKLQTFLKQMRGPLKNKKVLIFTAYVDTANYIFKNGIQADDSEVVASKDKDKSRIVARFAPKANAAIWQKCRDKGELRVVVATDVLAEGLNMQDCDIIVNYDLQWNPVRLIQRFGRIDRIGSEHDEIYGYNFLPEKDLEKNLGIEEVLKKRIDEIHRTLGSDAAVLHPDEKLDEAGMAAIYTGEGELVREDESNDELALLNEAEVLLRRLQEEEPDVWETILNLRQGVRSVKVDGEHSGEKIVLCRAGDYARLYLCDGEGKVLSRDVELILPLLQTAREVPAPQIIPHGHNHAVMRVREEFAQEVELRHAQQLQFRRATAAQKWVAARLLEYYRLTEDENLKKQIQIVEAALRTDGLPQSARRSLNQLHKQKLAGEALWREAVKVYSQHQLQQLPPAKEDAQEEHPQLVCSLALT